MVALLKTTDEENSFLESPPEALDATRSISHSVTEKLGAVVGQYKLMEQIGEGGMGTVFVAKNQTPGTPAPQFQATVPDNSTTTRS